jgi:molecular chaperone Hsp33
VISAPREGAGDELVRTVSADGSFAARALVATDLVAEAAERHDTAPTATAALGRALMGAVLLGAGAPDDERVQLHFRGRGPVRSVLAISDNQGRARGFVGNPAAHPPPRNGKLDVGAAVGAGTLAVVRDHPSWRKPYSGFVPIVSGEIAEDIAHYLLESEQAASVMALGVFVGSDGSVGAAGGFLVQAMPEASDDAVAILEGNVRALESPSQMVRAGLRPVDILDRLLVGLGSSERHSMRPGFYCPCDRNRIVQAVVALGRDEMQQIVDDGEELEIRCEFCCATYSVSPEEVRTVLRDV